MIVNLTIPVNVNGKGLCEFEAAVDVEVTYKGSSDSYLSPGDAPEWNVNEYYVDCGGWVREKQRYVTDYEIAPVPFKNMIEEYLDSVEGINDMQRSVEEALMEERTG